ncbi:MAG: 50S ribosomal protein L11 methyltransferase [Pseudobdellovibrionaceae bacterium]
MPCAEPALQDTPLFNVTLRVPATATEDNVIKAASLHDEDAVSVSWERIPVGGWVVQWILPFHPKNSELRKALSPLMAIDGQLLELEVSKVPDINWLAESYRQFPPFEVGSFFVHGSHFVGLPPRASLPLLIDAATAFGSGEHGTTRGCLEALEYLKHDGFKPSSVLDMGSGSGILAIAAWRLWHKPVLAVDIDREATRVACRHRTINHIPSGPLGLTCTTGDGYRARRVSGTHSYNLIIANILAGPLVIMAPQLAKKLASGGRAILSGLLLEQETEVLNAHVQAGLQLHHRIVHGEWVTLILRT